jgi:DTW domain-containing protein YfiP
MRSRTAPGLANRCHRCYLLLEVCLCDSVVEVPSRARFTVIRHAKEAHKTTNSARIAALALPGCEILEYGRRDTVFDEEPLIEEGAFLLFPGAETRPAPESVRRVIVIDGTWPQARNILRRLERVRALPRLSLTPALTQVERLRRPPFPGGMSTLEAIAEAVAHVDGEERAQPLRALHSRMVERVLLGRGVRFSRTG